MTWWKKSETFLLVTIPIILIQFVIISKKIVEELKNGIKILVGQKRCW